MGGEVEGSERFSVSSGELLVIGKCRPRMGHECTNGRGRYSFIRGIFVDGFVLARS